MPFLKLECECCERQSSQRRVVASPRPAPPRLVAFLHPGMKYSLLQLGWLAARYLEGRRAVHHICEYICNRNLEPFSELPAACLVVSYDGMVGRARARARASASASAYRWRAVSMAS